MAKKSTLPKGTTATRDQISKIGKAIGDKNFGSKFEKAGGSYSDGGGSSGSSGSSSSSKALTYAPGSLETMTVAQANAAGRGQEYSNMVAGYGYGVPNTLPVPTTTGTRSATRNISSPITVGELSNFSAVTQQLPPPPTPDTFNGYGIGAVTGATSPADTTTTDRFSSYEDFVKKQLEEPEKLDRAQIEEQAGLTAAAAQARGIKSQIDATNAQLQSQILLARESAGQEGGTVAGVGGRTSQLEREAAIRLMPLQAAYQTAVDNVNGAREIVSNYIADERAYRQEVATYKNNIYERALSLATRDEDKAVREEQTKYNRQKDLEDRQLDAIDKAYQAASELEDTAAMNRITKLASYVGKPGFDLRYEAASSGLVNHKAPAAKEATGLERQSLAFFNRAEAALNDVEKVEDSISKLSLFEQTRLNKVPTVLQTEEQQLYRQAQKAFTEARLRKESGAAIPESEFANDRETYFAQPGNSVEVLNQKRAAREQVLLGMKFASGNAFEEFYGFPPSFESKSTRLGDNSSSGRVKVISPDGSVGTIPADQLEEALGSGYKKQ